MKVKSEDCVKWALRSFPELKETVFGRKMWKRLRKSKTPQGITREFQIFPDSSRIDGFIGYWDLNVLEAPDGSLSGSLAPRMFNERGQEVDREGRFVGKNSPVDVKFVPGAGGPLFIYAVGSEDLMGDGPTTIIYINTVKCWQEMRCLTDSYGPLATVIIPLTEKLGLYEIMESMFELGPEVKLEDVEAGLKEAGIVRDAEFEAWMKTAREEDAEE